MKLIAHRGASGYAPENTLASFRKAVSMGAKEVEEAPFITEELVKEVHGDSVTF